MDSYKFIISLSYLVRDNHRLASMAFYVHNRNTKLTAEECVKRAKEMIRVSERDSYKTDF